MRGMNIQKSLTFMFHLHNVLRLAQRSRVLRLVVTHIRKYEPLKEAVAFLSNSNRQIQTEDDRRFSVETSLPSFLRTSFDVQISQCPTFLIVIMQIPDGNFSIFRLYIRHSNLERL